MQFAIVSDTHIPAREEEIPEPFRDRIAAADHGIHAGDFETQDVLADARSLATELTAVQGNADPRVVDLPSVASTTVGGVGGHTHRVEDEIHEGIRVLNPGSATGADPSETATMMTAEVGDGDIDVTVHEA